MRFRTLLAATMAVALTARAGLTQAPTPPSFSTGIQESMQTSPQETSSPCDYDTCALRLQIQNGGWTVTRGEQATPVGRIGFRVPNVASLVATVPDAVTEARRFQRNYPLGGVVTVLGGVAAMVGFKLSGFERDNPVAYTIGVAGTVMLFYGATKQNRALNALNNAIWLYNRSLAGAK